MPRALTATVVGAYPQRLHGVPRLDRIDVQRVIVFKVEFLHTFHQPGQPSQTVVGPLGNRGMLGAGKAVTIHTGEGMAGRGGGQPLGAAGDGIPKLPPHSGQHPHNRPPASSAGLLASEPVC